MVGGVRGTGEVGMGGGGDGGLLLSTKHKGSYVTRHKRTPNEQGLRVKKKNGPQKRWIF